MMKLGVLKMSLFKVYFPVRWISVSISSLNYASSIDVKKFDKESAFNRIREPAGYIAPHRWHIQRPGDDRLSHILFGSQPQRSNNSSEEDTFLASRVHATLSGIPTTTDFSYDEISSVSEIPQLDTRLYENLSRMGLNQLTPVQRHAVGIMSIDESTMIRNDPNEFERVVGKYDLMAAAQTGSGKTLAYLIPIVNRLLRIYPYEAMQARMKSDCQFPSALILAPTRELVQQILSEVSKLCYRSFLRPVCLFGGERPPRQLNELSKGCHMVVATPGRLLDFLRQRALRLNHCRALVLDEADRMLDMGFEEQLREILEAPEFGMPVPKDSERQTCLYSATFPREVTLLARTFLRGPRCISLTLSDSDQDAGTIVPEWGKTGRRLNRQDDEINRLSRIVPREISQRFEFVEDDSYTALQKYLIQRINEIMDQNTSSADSTSASDTSSESQFDSDCRILVFCNTKREVDELNNAFCNQELRSAAIHGDKAQMHRTRVLDWFRRGRINILVASSVAARGLDIPNVRTVINIGLPVEVDDYVHRIGRTGRMGHPGEALTVVSDRLLQRSSRSVAHGILRLVQRSTGSVDGVPACLLHLAQWDPSKLDNPEPLDDRPPQRPRQKPGYISKSFMYDRSTYKRPFNKRNSAERWDKTNPNYD